MRTRPLAAVALAALLLAGCGSSDNGESAKKGPQVADDAAAALEKAGAVRLTGSGTMDSQPMKVDLDLQGSDVTGTLTLSGQPVDLTVVGGKFYMKGATAFWTSSGVPQALAGALGGKWVVVPSGTASGLDQFTIKGLANQLRHPTGATIKNPVHTGTLNGKKVVVVTQTDGSTLDVAATGTPYPLQTVDKGKDGGTITVSDFGKKTAISAPKGALDLSKIGSSGGA